MGEGDQALAFLRLRLLDLQRRLHEVHMTPPKRLQLEPADAGQDEGKEPQPWLARQRTPSRPGGRYFFTRGRSTLIAGFRSMSLLGDSAFADVAQDADGKLDELRRQPD